MRITVRPDRDVRDRHVGDRCDVPRRGVRSQRDLLQPGDHLLRDDVPCARGIQRRLADALAQRLVRDLQIPQRVHHRTLTRAMHVRQVRRVVQLLEHAEQRPPLGPQCEGLALRRRGLLHDRPLHRVPLHRVHDLGVHVRVLRRRVSGVPALEPLQRGVELVVQPQQFVGRIVHRHLPELVTTLVHHVRQQLLPRVHVPALQVLPQPLRDREQHQPVDLPPVAGLDRVHQILHHLGRRGQRGRVGTRRERAGQDVHLGLLVVSGGDVHRRHVRVHDRPVPLHQRSVRVHPLVSQRAHQVPAGAQVGERRVIQDQLRLLHDLVAVEVPAERLQHRVRHLEDIVRVRPRQVRRHLRHERLVRAGLVLRVPHEHQRGRPPSGILLRRVRILGCHSQVVQTPQRLVDRADLRPELQPLLVVTELRRTLPVLLERLHQRLHLSDHDLVPSQLRSSTRLPRRVQRIRPPQERRLLTQPSRVRPHQLHHLVEGGHDLVAPHLHRLRLRDHERSVRPCARLRRLLVSDRPACVVHLLHLGHTRRTLGGLRRDEPLERLLQQLRLLHRQLGRRLLLRRRHPVPLRSGEHLLRGGVRVVHPLPASQHRPDVRSLVRRRLSLPLHPGQPRTRLHTGAHGETRQPSLVRLPPVHLVVERQRVQHALHELLVALAHTRDESVRPLPAALRDPGRRTVVVVRRDHVVATHPCDPRRLHPRRDRRQLLRRRQHRHVHRGPLVVPLGPLCRPRRIQLHTPAAHTDGLPTQPGPHRQRVVAEHPRDATSGTHLHRVDRHRPDPRRRRDGIEVPLVVREHVVERAAGVRERVTARHRQLRHPARDLGSHLSHVRQPANTGTELHRRIPEPGHHTQARQPRRALVLPLVVRRVPLAPVVTDVTAGQPVVRAVHQVGQRLDELPRQPAPAQQCCRGPAPRAELLPRHVLLHPRTRCLVQDLVLVQQRRTRTTDSTRSPAPRARPPHRGRTTQGATDCRQGLVQQRRPALELRSLRLDPLVVVLLRQELRLPCRLRRGLRIHRTGHRIHVSTRLVPVQLAPLPLIQGQRRQDLVRLRTGVQLTHIPDQLAAVVHVAELRRPALRVLRPVVRHDPGEVLALVQVPEVVPRRLLLLLLEERLVERGVPPVLDAARAAARVPQWTTRRLRDLSRRRRVSPVLPPLRPRQDVPPRTSGRTRRAVRGTLLRDRVLLLTHPRRRTRQDVPPRPVVLRHNRSVPPSRRHNRDYSTTATTCVLPTPSQPKQPQPPRTTTNVHHNL